MKKAIVTGAGGFIGGALTKELLKREYKVYGVDISLSALKKFDDEENFVPLCIDLNKGKISERIADSNIDVIFYLAWGGSLKGGDLLDTKLQINNIKTAVNVIEDIKNKCVRFIFCASSYEYMRDISGKNITVSIYGSAKKAASEMCASIAYRNKIDFNKIILTNTYGIGDKSDKAVNTIIRIMLNKGELKLVKGDNRNDWVYIDDTVNGIIAAAEHGQSFHDYYIGHRDITTFKEKIIMMRDILCPEMELVFGKMNEDTYVNYDLIDLDALYNDTGFECKAGFEESIRKTAEWITEINKENSQTEHNSFGGGYNLVIFLPVIATKAVAI